MNRVVPWVFAEADLASDFDDVEGCASSDCRPGCACAPWSVSRTCRTEKGASGRGDTFLYRACIVIDLEGAVSAGTSLVTFGRLVGAGETG